MLSLSTRCQRRISPIVSTQITPGFSAICGVSRAAHFYVIKQPSKPAQYYVISHRVSRKFCAADLAGDLVARIGPSWAQRHIGEPPRFAQGTPPGIHVVYLPIS